MDYQSLGTSILVIILVVGAFMLKRWAFNVKRKQRRDYYRSYLQSDNWKRKRYVVFKRDNWKCVYCGARATEVHHLKYAKYNIGKEPIDWLVSVCQDCHKSRHF